MKESIKKITFDNNSITLSRNSLVGFAFHLKSSLNHVMNSLAKFPHFKAVRMENLYYSKNFHPSEYININVARNQLDKSLDLSLLEDKSLQAKFAIGSLTLGKYSAELNLNDLIEAMPYLQFKHVSNTTITSLVMNNYSITKFLPNKAEYSNLTKTIFDLARNTKVRPLPENFTLPATIIESKSEEEHLENNERVAVKIAAQQVDIIEEQNLEIKITEGVVEELLRVTNAHLPKILFFKQAEQNEPDIKITSGTSEDTENETCQIISIIPSEKGEESATTIQVKTIEDSKSNGEISDSNANKETQNKTTNSTTDGTKSGQSYLTYTWNYLKEQASYSYEYAYNTTISCKNSGFCTAAVFAVTAFTILHFTSGAPLYGAAGGRNGNGGILPAADNAQHILQGQVVPGNNNPLAGELPPQQNMIPDNALPPALNQQPHSYIPMGYKAASLPPTTPPLSSSAATTPQTSIFKTPYLKLNSPESTDDTPFNLQDDLNTLEEQTKKRAREEENPTDPAEDNADKDDSQKTKRTKYALSEPEPMDEGNYDDYSEQTQATKGNQLTSEVTIAGTTDHTKAITEYVRPKRARSPAAYPEESDDESLRPEKRPKQNPYHERTDSSHDMSNDQLLTLYHTFLKDLNIEENSSSKEGPTVNGTPQDFEVIARLKELIERAKIIIANKNGAAHSPLGNGGLSPESLDTIAKKLVFKDDGGDAMSDISDGSSSHFDRITIYTPKGKKGTLTLPPKTPITLKKKNASNNIFLTKHGTGDEKEKLALKKATEEFIEGLINIIPNGEDRSALGDLISTYLKAIFEAGVKDNNTLKNGLNQFINTAPDFETFKTSLKPRSMKATDITAQYLQTNVEYLNNISLETIEYIKEPKQYMPKYFRYLKSRIIGSMAKEISDTDNEQLIARFNNVALDNALDSFFSRFYQKKTFYPKEHIDNWKANFKQYLNEQHSEERFYDEFALLKSLEDEYHEDSTLDYDNAEEINDFLRNFKQYKQTNNQGQFKQNLGLEQVDNEDIKYITEDTNDVAAYVRYLQTVLKYKLAKAVTAGILFYNTGNANAQDQDSWSITCDINLQSSEIYEECMESIIKQKTFAAQVNQTQQNEITSEIHGDNIIPRDFFCGTSISLLLANKAPKIYNSLNLKAPILSGFSVVTTTLFATDAVDLMHVETTQYACAANKEITVQDFLNLAKKVVCFSASTASAPFLGSYIDHYSFTTLCMQSLESLENQLSTFAGYNTAEINDYSA